MVADFIKPDTEAAFSRLKPLIYQKSPLAFLDTIASPTLSFHLESTTYRFLFDLRNTKSFNNFEFWNYVCLRQYLHYLAQSMRTESLKFIIPYIKEIKKTKKAARIIREITQELLNDDI